jgi:hypothetical protein
MNRTAETLRVEAAVAAGLQSHRWERYNKHQFKPGERIRVSIEDSFPKPKTDGATPTYDLIARNGNRFVATPEFRDPTSGVILGVWRINYGHGRSWLWTSQTFIAWRERQETPQE